MGDQDNGAGDKVRPITIEKLMDAVLASPHGLAFKFDTPEHSYVQVIEFVRKHDVPVYFKRVGDFLALIPKKETK